MDGFYYLYFENKTDFKYYRRVDELSHAWKCVYHFEPLSRLKGFVVRQSLLNSRSQLLGYQISFHFMGCLH